MNSEFDRIRALRAVLPEGGPHVVVGNGDDAAVLRIPGDVVVTTDALVEGVDFDARFPWDAVGRKAVGANASDLAAMGADPVGFLLVVAAPADLREDAWAGLAAGAADAARAHALPCHGGDLSSTKGPVVVCITALGSVPPGSALVRSGARPGDGVWISGTLGGAAAGLKRTAAFEWRPEGVQAALASVSSAEERDALARQLCPVARLALGRALRGVATACIDTSDGTLQDLCHVLAASGVGAALEEDRLPRHPALAALPPDEARRLAWAGGEDFELLFTAPDAAAVERAARAAGTPVARVGTITRDRALVLHGMHAGWEDVLAMDAGGTPPSPGLAALRGWRHFGG
ncbi:MAG: thiamine-phosphate kinase [Deltaproteobacteria bacterium]|nr:thiamine-phosphate kinase [Deltaproteobacteria bacterium]